MTRRSTDYEAIEAEIDRIRSLGLDDLRMLWRTTLRSSPPPAFTKDLVARFICWHASSPAPFWCANTRVTDTQKVLISIHDRRLHRIGMPRPGGNRDF